MGREPGRNIGREAAGFAVVAGVFGLSFGMAAHVEGLPWYQSTVFSVLTFAGASQFATVGILATGGSALAIVVTSALLNARFLPLSIAVANRIRFRGWRRAPATLVMTDPSALFALQAPDPQTARRWYWIGGLATWGAWSTGTAAGALIAETMAFDPKTLGLDVALPALLLGLSASALRQRVPLAFLGFGSVAAIGAMPLVAAGVEYLIVGLGAGLAAIIGLGDPREDDRPEPA
ncbi:MAG: AzlC family ABC transporter permease [Acidimicrobiales bacterium]|nr:AzlC family ABC transporter permease [Acidimicrobiales bacterium]